MKILQINSVYKNGSTGSIVFGIHKYLQKQPNTESYVCYGRGKKYKDENVYKVSTELFSKINHFIAKYLTGIPYSGNWLATQKLIHKIKQIKPDVVHIHNLNDYYVNEYKLLTYLAKHKYKTIITMHSEQYYTGTCGYSLECNAWKENGCKKCPHIELSTKSKIDKCKKSYIKLKKVYSLFDISKLSFVACTPWLEDRAKASFLLSKFKISTILNGGDDNIFYPNTKNNDALRKIHNIKTGDKVVLFVCPRLNDPIKGYQYIPQIRSDLPDNYKIIVVGKILKDTKIETNIIYTGEITDKLELAKYYNLADVTTMLSKRECFPMVIVESLLCGTPVVSFKCFGPDNAFDDSALFVDYGDINTLIRTIIVNKKNTTTKLTTTKMGNSYFEKYKQH